VDVIDNIRTLKDKIVFSVGIKWTQIRATVAMYTIVVIYCIGFVGCSGIGTQGKSAMGIGIDSVEVFSQKANAMVKVSYSELRFEVYDQRLEVIGTENGAIASHVSSNIDPWQRERGGSYSVGYEPLEIELNMDEWRVFFNALLSTGIQRWKRERYGNKYIVDMDGDGYRWGLCIYTKDGEDKDTLIFSSGYNGYPPNWYAVDSLIRSFITMMYERKQKLRELEYAKRFGKPMSEYENSIKEIFYRPTESTSTSVELKTSGEVVLFHNHRVKLNIEDWLDIINALGNINDGSIRIGSMGIKGSTLGYVTAYDSISQVNERQYFYDRFVCEGRYHFGRTESDLAKIEKCQDSLSRNKTLNIKPLPVSEELRNIMDGIMAKITCED